MPPFDINNLPLFGYGALGRIGQAPSPSPTPMFSAPPPTGPQFGPAVPPGPATGPVMGPPAPSMVARAVAQMGGGKGGGYLSNKLAGLPTAGQGLRSLGRGSLGRAGAYGLAGQVGSMGINALWDDPNSPMDNAAAAAAGGAGIGAGIGSLIAPGPGTAIGAGVGALAGGAFGYLTGKGEGGNAVAKELAKRQGQLNQLLDQLGASDELRDQAQFQLQMGVATGEAGSKGDVANIYKQVQAMLPEALMADRQQQEQTRMKESNMAAVQAWMAPMMQQQLSQSQWYADQFGNQMQAAAGQIQDPGMRAAQQALASSISSQQASTNAAYAAQIAAAPSAWGYQSDLLSQLRQAQQQLSQQPGGMDAILQMMQAA